jgi:hypothetical protein
MIGFPVTIHLVEKKDLKNITSRVKIYLPIMKKSQIESQKCEVEEEELKNEMAFTKKLETYHSRKL